MNYTKISELPVATTTASPDITPIVQAGQTMQVDVGTLRRSPNLSIYGELYDSVFVRGITPDLSIGDNDIYTVPTARAALITGGRLQNDSGGNVIGFPEMKHGGTYFRIGNSTASIANGAGAAMSIQGSGIALSAGDSFAINAAITAGANALYLITEFSDESSLKPAFLFGTASGDNTLYTVPVGKTAIPISLGVTIGAASGSFNVGAGSVGTGQIFTKITQSGGTPIISGAISGGASANTAVAVANNTFSLEAGDSVILNITTGDSAQIAWGIFMEIDI